MLLYDARSKNGEGKVAAASKSTPPPVGASQVVGNPNTQPTKPASGDGLFTLELDVKAPLLSSWLAMCDRNTRGEAGDKFAGMVFGFERLEICRLTDLRDVKPEFLQSLDLEQEDGSIKKMTMGMALRLARLIQEDLKVYDQKVASLRNN